jgi:hypothetical protein
VAKGGSVFFGNNEDWRNSLIYIWVDPAGDGKYGVLCVGFDDLGPQGGTNEKGLSSTSRTVSPTSTTGIGTIGWLNSMWPKRSRTNNRPRGLKIISLALRIQRWGV